MLDYMVPTQVVVGCGVATSDALVVYGVRHFKHKIRSAVSELEWNREDAGTPVNLNCNQKKKLIRVAGICRETGFYEKRSLNIANQRCERRE